MENQKIHINEICNYITIGDKKLVPIIELMFSQLRRIFGQVVEDEITITFVKAHEDEDSYGVIATYYESRVGFTLNYTDKYTEFELSVNSNRMMINQLEMFDQLRAWNFNI